jgi:hypothetical protein
MQSDAHHPFARGSRRRFTADDCSKLDPCSLASPLFLERCTKRIRDLMTPDDFCNCLRRTSTHRSSRFLAGTEAATSFLFFYGSRCIPYETGEPRRAAHSSSDFPRPRCWFLPLPWVCPTAMPREPRHLRSTCAARSVVTIDVHGPLDRVKDVSPESRLAFFRLSRRVRSLLCVR